MHKSKAMADATSLLLQMRALTAAYKRLTHTPLSPAPAPYGTSRPKPARVYRVTPNTLRKAA